MSQLLGATCVNPDRTDAMFFIGVSARLDLTVTNSGTEPLDLLAAAPGKLTKEADNDRAHPDPSALYVYLDEFVDPAVIPTLAITVPTGWAADYYFDETGHHVWALTCVDQTLSPLAPGAGVTARFTGLVITGATRTTAAVVDPRVIPDFIGSLRCPVSLVTPSSYGPLPVDVAVTRTDPALWVGADDVVYTSTELPVTNRLVLTLVNAKVDEPLIKSWKDVAPTFSVSFTYADGPPGDGALTTPASLAAPFEMTQGDTHGLHFVGPDSDGNPYPSWALRPQTDNANVLAAGGSVQIVIDGLPVPLCEGDAWALITSSGFPMYADGAWAVHLTKTAPAPCFNPRPQPLTPSAVTAFAPVLCPPLEVSWDAFGATSFEVKWNEGADTHSAQVAAPATSYTLDPQPSVDGVVVNGLSVTAAGPAGPPADGSFAGEILVEQLFTLLTSAAWWCGSLGAYAAMLFGADGNLYNVTLNAGGPHGLITPWTFDPDLWVVHVDEYQFAIDRDKGCLTNVDYPDQVWQRVTDPLEQFLTCGLFEFTAPGGSEGSILGFAPNGWALYMCWSYGHGPYEDFQVFWSNDGGNVHVTGPGIDLELTPHSSQGTLTDQNYGYVFSLNPFPS